MGSKEPKQKNKAAAVSLLARPRSGERLSRVFCRHASDAFLHSPLGPIWFPLCSHSLFQLLCVLYCLEDQLQTHVKHSMYLFYAHNERVYYFMTRSVLYHSFNTCLRSSDHSLLLLTIKTKTPFCSKQQICLKLWFFNKQDIWIKFVET